MNQRYSNQSYERGDRDRDRDPYGRREGRNPNESGREFSAGNYDFTGRERHYDQGQSDEIWSGERDRGSGGSRYGASGYGDYGSESRRYEQDFSGGYRGYGGSSGYEGSGYGRSGSSNWRQQEEGGSYGGYGSTGDYGYGSQGRNEWGERSRSPEFGRSSGWRDDAAPYYGVGNYASGGSGYGGGYYGGGRQASSFGGGSAYGGRQSWSEQGSEEQRPGLLKRIFGRGPKGYKRSDERLREDISERLMQSDTIDSSEVTIEVADGRVTLQGTVPERYMKHAIEDVADSCLGVQDVDNRIRVERDRGLSTSSNMSSTTSTTSSATLGTESGNGSKVRKQ